jgi:hypothetical protein
MKKKPIKKKPLKKTPVKKAPVKKKPIKKVLKKKTPAKKPIRQLLVKKLDDRMQSPNLETQEKHKKQQASAWAKRPRKKASLTAQHYVDAKDLNFRIETYYKSGDPELKDEELAQMISKIANRLAFAPNFINYSYREDFIGDATIKMFAALKNKKFKINKGYNAFSYFTKIAFNAFCNRIKREKKNHEAILAYQEEVYDTLLTHGHASHKVSTENPEE